MEEVTANLREAIEGWLSVESPEAVTTQRDRVVELAL
jgi:predicted RNase H-like HicB family nuclease